MYEGVKGRDDPDSIQNYLVMKLHDRGAKGCPLKLQHRYIAL